MMRQLHLLPREPALRSVPQTAARLALSTKRLRAAWWPVLVLSCSACDSSPPPLYQDHGVNYFAASNDPEVCPEVTAAIQKLLRSYEAYGLDSPPESLDYYKYNSLTLLNTEGCGFDGLLVAGCYFREQVKSTAPLHLHELMHASTRRSLNHLDNPLVEGITSAYTCSPYEAPGTIEQASDFAASYDGQAFDFSYEAWSKLAMALLRHGDLSRYAQLSEEYSSRIGGRALSASTLEEQLRELLKQQYDLELEQLLEEALEPGAPSCLPVGRLQSPLASEGLSTLRQDCRGLQEYRLPAGKSGGFGLLSTQSLQLAPTQNRLMAPVDRSLSFAGAAQLEGYPEFDSPERLQAVPEVEWLILAPESGLKTQDFSYRALPSAYLPVCPQAEELPFKFGLTRRMSWALPSSEAGIWFYLEPRPEAELSLDHLEFVLTQAGSSLEPPADFKLWNCTTCPEASGKPSAEELAAHCQQLSFTTQPIGWVDQASSQEPEFKVRHTWSGEPILAARLETATPVRIFVQKGATLGPKLLQLEVLQFTKLASASASSP